MHSIEDIWHSYSAYVYVVIQHSKILPKSLVIWLMASVQCEMFAYITLMASHQNSITDPEIEGHRASTAYQGKMYVNVL